MQGFLIRRYGAQNSASRLYQWVKNWRQESYSYITTSSGVDPLLSSNSLEACAPENARGTCASQALYLYVVVVCCCFLHHSPACMNMAMLFYANAVHIHPMVVTHINTQRGTQPHCLSNVSNNGAKSESSSFRMSVRICCMTVQSVCVCTLCCIAI